MSTFGGKIQEIENISIDRFIGENLFSEAFFLSHCHTDHMEGIWSDEFNQQLEDNNKILYASQISCKILEQMDHCFKYHCKALDLMVPTTIYLKDSHFSVTLIPAGHCPGSVMFLFESDKRILYTGDYRIRKSDISKFNCFFDNEGKIKVIDKIYLDTTFFHKKYLNFPKREESLREICEIIEEWITKGKDFHIYLDTSAKYGYEYLFKEIFMKIGMPIHINYDANKLYSLVPELDCAVTSNSGITQLHSHCFGWRRRCTFSDDSNVKTIKVSALRWDQEDLAQGLSEYKSGIHYVCYSTHASYEEGVEFIRFFKPKEIDICVKHQDPQLNREMSDDIDELVKEFHVENRIIVMPKLFNTDRKRKKFKSNKRHSTSQILNSPPRLSFVEGYEIKSENISYQVSASKEKCIIESTSKEEYVSLALFDTDTHDKNSLSLPSSPQKVLPMKRSIDTVDEADIVNVIKPLNQKEEVEESVQNCKIKSENVSYQVSAYEEKCIIESTSKEEYLPLALFDTDVQENNNLSLPSSPQKDLSVKRSIDTVDEAEINVVEPLNQMEEVEDSVLFNLIFTPPETSSEDIKEHVEVDTRTDNLEDEDSVILKIINFSYDSER
uniref:Protein artemis n=1 Tax=Diabrotica virgifera virgifera TaxID=50390 RepID=A0A6P7F9D0_DIAVI